MSIGTSRARVALALGWLAACSPPAPTPQADPAPLFVRFRDAALDRLKVESGASGSYFMPEIMGFGGALADLDGDGDLDVVVVLGKAGGVAGNGPGGLALLRNELRERGTLAFTDVSAASGLTTTSYPMGVAVGDFDGDGREDLYLTAFGPDSLFRNQGSLTFRDVTAASGITGDEWTVSALPVDGNGDGRLDLLVPTYVDFTLARHQVCPSPLGEPDYCGPVTYRAVADRWWINRGDGTFVDASVASGIARLHGSGLGAIELDADRDGRLDLYVANDKMPNRLWIQQGDGTFVDDAPARGVAVDGLGVAEAGMGVDAGDFDADGDEDLAIAHFRGESHTLYRNDGATFRDVTAEVGLLAPSLASTGFGAAWLDADHDGILDLLIVAGDVHRAPGTVGADFLAAYGQPAQLFLGRRDGRFSLARGQGELDVAAVSRGLAVGDVDDDGDLDALVVDTGSAPRLLLARGAPRGWLGLRVLGPAGSALLGAEVRLASPEGELRRRVRSSGSYASARDPRLLVGAPGSATRVAVVRSTAGRCEAFDLAGSERYVDLVAGAGRELAECPP